MEELLLEAQTAEIAWIGEVHGIQENYQVYKTLLPPLFNMGYKNLLWEMPTNFGRDSADSEDGKISQYARDFLHWLEEQKYGGNISDFKYFGQIHDFLDYEKAMSNQLVNILGRVDSKTIILTGNYHLQNNTAKSAQEYVAENTSLKILKVDIVYSGGSYFNHGIKTFNKPIEHRSMKFGTILKKGDTYLFHVGEAHDVHKKPAAN